MGGYTILQYLLVFSSILYVFCEDSVIITSMQIQVEETEIYCGKTNITIEGKPFNATCQYTSPKNDPANFDNTTIILTPNDINVQYDTKNLTIEIKLETGDVFTGILPLDDKIPVNVISSKSVEFGIVPSTAPTTLATTPTTVKTTPTTTSIAPKRKRKSKQPAETITESDYAVKKAHVRVEFVRIKYDEPKKEEESNGNRGAVAVAIIEGVILIIFISYFGYTTMVAHKFKSSRAPAAAYDLDAQRNSVRMSDIPPARDTSYYSQPPPPFNSLPRTTVTTPDLVVPSSTAARTTTSPISPTPAPSGQFNDPFASLDNW